MNSKTAKILATVVVLVGAIGSLMYTSLAEGTEYYKHVDEVMVDPAAWHGKKLQLHGFVVEKSIMRKPGTLEYIFQVHSKGHVVDARYTGIVPDTFKDNSEVVIQAARDRLVGHGDGLARHLARCLPEQRRVDAGRIPSLVHGMQDRTRHDAMGGAIRHRLPGLDCLGQGGDAREAPGRGRARELAIDLQGRDERGDRRYRLEASRRASYRGMYNSISTSSVAR